MERILDWMEKNGIESITTASIGGSATWGMEWPEDLPSVGEGAVIQAYPDLQVGTRVIPSVKIVRIEGTPVIRVRMHGWGKPPKIDDSIGVLLLLKELGVKQVIVDASVGGLSVNPWDIVIAHDFIPDPLAKLAAARFAEEAGVGTWSRMVKPFCPELRRILYATAGDYKVQKGDGQKLGELHKEGVYLGTWGPFETAAEISDMRENGTHTIVGQSTPQEAMMARLCGMCFGGIYIAANFAERGEVAIWVEGSMRQFYLDCAIPMGEIVWNALGELVHRERVCECATIPFLTDLSGFPVEGA